MSFPERTSDASQWTVSDLTVDLSVEFEAALSRKLPLLKVYADVVRVPEDFAKTLGGYKREPGSYLRHIQIIARRLEVTGGSCRLRINPPAPGDDLSTVSLLLGEVAGKLAIEKINYDGNDKPSVGDKWFAQPTGENEDLSYLRYSSRTKDGQFVKESRPVPLNLLGPGEPLHEVLAASYAYAASLTAEPIPPADPKNWELARQVFDWLARWTKYPSRGVIGQSEIASFAELLTRVLPSLFRNSIVYAIPPRRSKTCLSGLQTQFTLATAMEAGIVAAANRKDLKETFGEFVTTLSERDAADLLEIDVLIDAATRRVESANASVEEAAEVIKDLRLESKLKQIRLEAEKEMQKVLDTVKAVFEVVYGLYQLISGVGSGVLAAQAQGAVKAVGQIPTIMRQLLVHAGQSDEGLKSKAFQVMYTLGYLPYSEMYQAWNSIDEKVRESVIGSIKNGVPSLLEGGGKLNKMYLKENLPEKDLSAIASLVSDATRAFDAAKAKAAWDSFQIDVEKKLDKEIEPDKGDVSKAARELRATLKKLVVAGKLFAEQQSTLALANRELGTLILRRSTLKRSRALFNELSGKLANDEEKSEFLITAAKAKLMELNQSFFARTWEYKAAYFNEFGKWPKPLARIPGTATDLGSIYFKLETESKSDSGNGDLVALKTVSIVVDDPDVLDTFKQTGEAPFTIDFKDRNLSGYQRIRLTKLVPAMEGVKSKITGEREGYTLSLTSAPTYLDRIDGQLVQWQGYTSSVSFSYNADGTVRSQPQIPFGGATPSPFTDWTVKVEKPAELDLTGVTKLILGIEADAVRQKS